MALGFGALQLDLTGTTSLADLQQRLKAYAAANRRAGWIIGRGWNQELWADKRFPTAADLDAVVGDRPVWLGRVDGHAAVGNSAALKAAGITAATRAPAGGRIENGLFVDAAMELVDRKIPAPDAAQYDAALAKAQELMLSTGLTAAADMGTSASDWAAMNRAGQAGTLNVRILGYAGGIPAMRAINDGRPSALALRRPAAAGRGQALHRRRAGVARGVAQGALSRQARHARAEPDQRCRTGQAGRRSGGERPPAGDPCDRRRRQRAGHLRFRASWAATSVATGAGGSSMPRCSMSPTCRASREPGSSPRCSRPTRPATGRWPRRGSGRSGSAGLMRGRPRAVGGAAGVRVGLPGRIAQPLPRPRRRGQPPGPDGQPPGGWRPHERVSFDAGAGRFHARRGLCRVCRATASAASMPGKYADFILVDRDISRGRAGRAGADAGARDVGGAARRCGSARLSGGGGVPGR